MSDKFCDLGGLDEFNPVGFEFAFAFHALHRELAKLGLGVDRAISSGCVDNDAIHGDLPFR